MKALTELFAIPEKNGVTLKEQLWFYVPMAATSVLMIATHSFFNAALSRLPSPKIYISAFAVAKGLMHIFESPIIMIRQAVSTLVSDARSYFRVRKFFILLTLLTVGALALVAFTGLSEWLFSNVIGVEGRVLEEAIIIFSVFVFFPAAAALRNFMQGIAVKLDRTPLFTVATFCRMLYVFVLILLVDQLSFLPGAIFAGLMFFTAVGMEGLVLLIGVKLSERDIAGRLDEITEQEEKDGQDQYTIKKMNNAYIFRFFWPLIITSIIHMAATPLVNMGLARSADPDVALSAFSVAWSLGLLVLSPAFMFHQQVINYFDRTREKTKSIKVFGFILGLLIVLVMALLGFTSLGYLIMRNLIGAPEDIVVQAVDVFRLMLFMGPVIMGREFYWGVLMKEGKTGYVSKAKVTHLISLVTTIIILLLLSPSNPAIIGVLAFIVADSMEVMFLAYTAHSKKIITSEEY